MDQCIVDFEKFCMLYFDLAELIELIEKYGSEDLKEYLDGLKERLHSVE